MADEPTMSQRAARRIKGLLGSEDVTKSELARRLGVSHTWVTNRLNGSQEIGLNELERIAEVLGVSVTDLIPTRAQAGKAASLTYPDGRHAPRTPVSLITGHHRPVTPRIADHRLRRPERVN